MRLRLARHLLAALLALLALGVLASSDAWADRFPHSGPRDGGLPASVRRIQRETGGEVLKAQPIERDGREVYRVKVLTPQGRIRVVEDQPDAEDYRRESAQEYPRSMQQEGPRGPQQDYQRPPQDLPRQRQYPQDVPRNGPLYPRPVPPMVPRQPPPARYSPQHNR